MHKLLSKCWLFCALVLFASSFSSCVSYKSVPYFQDLDTNQVKIDIAKFNPQLIQKSDLIGVDVNALNAGTETLFGGGAAAAGGTAAGATAGGFLVDQNGEIDMPTLGKIKLEGLTTEQAKELITQKVILYVKNPTVTVKILNFKVSITGEVNKAGTYPIENEKVTVLEAISLAGDLKITGRRENILVIRRGEGELKFARLDFRSKKVFSSPYFYLQNNDVVYVEPNTKRLERDDNIYRNTALIISILTAISLAISRIN
jgi:polysaccharide export outer membrane protein